MRAVLFTEFGAMPSVRDVPDPVCPPDGAIIRVEATGLCRSDWHGWRGHDPDITVPHVPGHEFAGTIEEVGDDVTRWTVGERVTVPFVCACGVCGPCLAGDQQVCDNQFQPGFTHWGSFAELVAIGRADINLIRLPDDLDFVTAASLGCRFATAYRAVISQGRLREGEWVAVHGCGGVGLSAVMIAVATGAHVVAVDVSEAALAAATALGAEAVVDGSADDVAARVVEATGGGAHLSIDALGSTTTSLNSIACLRKRGRHIQVGLMVGDDARPAIPMDLVISRELEIRGSHGMAAHDYAAMLAKVTDGSLQPGRLVGRTIGLDRAPAALVAMDEPAAIGGMTVIVLG
ncbi:MAG TPA: zinc-dependent alcohol dehydrogenase family protein, partial [Candidatus Limnocylindrales bacterium]|nr:zinc-dependent alcohol dehydrogenase family protein [Candidatus Limnocylindrales bacterium]